MKAILHFLRPGKNCTIDIQPGELEEAPNENNSFIFRSNWPWKNYSKSKDYIQVTCKSNSNDVIFRMLLTYEQAKDLRKSLNNCMENFHND